METLFSESLIQTMNALKQRLNYQAFLDNELRKETWVKAQFPTVTDDADIRRLCEAFQSYALCRGCNKVSCPKRTCKYTFVGKVCWFNERVYLRWVTDCRDVKSLPSAAKYREQIETDQAAIAAARPHYGE